MAFVLIAGNSGAGKSAICQELLNRGFDACDGDSDGISNFVNREIGRVTKVGAVEELTPEFFRTHRYCFSHESLERLAKSAQEHLVFLCGGGANEREQLKVFDAIIYLVIDEETIRRRIAIRTENPFGKSAEQLEVILLWQDNADKYFGNVGAHKIDARQSLDRVVEEVLIFAQSLPNVIT